MSTQAPPWSVTHEMEDINRYTQAISHMHAGVGSQADTEIIMAWWMAGKLQGVPVDIGFWKGWCAARVTQP